MLKLLLTCLLASFCVPALAIYKCNAAGNIIYSDAPCSKDASIMARTHEPGAAEIEQARQLREQEKSTLKNLEKIRSQDDAKQDKLRAKRAKSVASERKKCAALALRSKWAEEDAATATLKKQAAAQRKARRAAEKYSLDCGKHSGA